MASFLLAGVPFSTPPFCTPSYGSVVYPVAMSVLLMVFVNHSKVEISLRLFTLVESINIYNPADFTDIQGYISLMLIPTNPIVIKYNKKN